jgi:hypothetical protein
MTKPVTIECDLHVCRGPKGRHKLGNGVVVSAEELEPGRVPRVARLMALAIRFEHLVRTGQVASYSHLARLGRVTRARISQIMNLLLLAPDIQEQVLSLPRVRHGRDPVQMRHLQPIALEWDWVEQRRRWASLLRDLLPQEQESGKTRQNCLTAASTQRLHIELIRLLYERKRDRLPAPEWHRNSAPPGQPEYSSLSHRPLCCTFRLSSEKRQRSLKGAHSDQP